MWNRGFLVMEVKIGRFQQKKNFYNPENSDNLEKGI